MSIHSTPVGDVKFDPHMNLHQVSSARSTYTYKNVYPDDQQRTQIFSSSGDTQTTTFKISTEDLASGESCLEYDFSILDQAANTYPVRYRNVDGEIYQVKYSDTGTNDLVNINNVHYYNEIMNPLNFSQEDNQFIESLDQRLIQTNAPVSDLKCKRADGSSMSVSYKEPQQLEWYPVGNGTNAYRPEYTKHKRIYLKDLVKDSFFGDNKNAILSAESYLTITWRGMGVGFLTTSPTDPTVGSGVGGKPIILQDGGGNKAFQVSNIVLRVALETNENNIKKMKQEVAQGSSIPITFAKVYTKPVDGGTGVFNFPQILRVQENGKNIKAIIYATMRTYNSGTPHLYYDHSNITENGAPTVNNVPGSKVAQYRTYMDSQPLQRDVMDVTKFDDYLYNKPSLVNTQYHSVNQHQFKWVHIDKFDYPKPNSNVEGNIMTDGYILPGDKTWSIDVTSRNASVDSLTNVCIVISQKMLVLDQNGFAVVSAPPPAAAKVEAAAAEAK